MPEDNTKLTKKAALSPEGEQIITPLAPQKPSFYTHPESPATNFVMEVLEAGTSIGDLPARKAQVDHSTHYEVMEDGNKRQITHINEQSKITIELSDIEKLTGSNKPAKKLFVLTLIKANEQALHDRKLTRSYVSFPLQELVDIGFYKTPQSARQGFKSGADVLTSIKIKGKLQQSKKKGSSIEALEVLFTGARIENSQCYLYLNDRIDWSFLAQYYTITPRYYFKLSNRASDLIDYIFYLARQHTRDIEEHGHFNIGFRAIQHRLQLPSEKKTPNPQRDIRDPIKAAVNEIRNNATEFSLLLIHNEMAPISDYLDKGYLQVTFTGDFAEYFIELSKETTKKIEARKKRQQRITDTAIALKLEKKMEADEKKKESQE